MALILTLGLLTVITLAVVAFVVTMRIEHLAASNTVHRAMARQYVDLGASEAMGIVDWRLIGNNASCYPVQGWATNTPGMPHFFEQDCFGCPSTNGDPICLFRGSATNLLPGTLAAQAGQVQSGWITISETNATTGSTGIQAGRVSFLVVNLSGMMDVHALNADRRQMLGEPNSAYALLGGATNGNYSRVFLTQPDLTAANQGQAASNLVTFSYDPGPDVFFAYTNLPALGTRAFANLLTNRFNINIATQYAGNFTSQAFQDNWFTPVSNLLADAGVTAPAPVAWNILNYLDSGHIPIVAAGAPPAFRAGYGVKDVPLINEVALLPIDGLVNHYGVSVELWYPFVPHTSPATKLWVGVYTNDPGTTAVSAFTGAHEPPPTSLSFELPVPAMDYDGTEYFVGTNNQYVVFEKIIPGTPPTINYLPIDASHPVWIWPRVYVSDSGGNDVCVDEALVCGNQLTRWEGTGSIQYGDPRTNHCAPVVVNATTSLAAPTLGTTNNPCDIPSLPLVLADAPMRSAGELRYIYAPGMPGGRIDFTTSIGGACRDRFTVLGTNAPVHGLVQANTPYTNIWQALLSDVVIGWTNQTHPNDCIGKIDAKPDTQLLLASAVANALLYTGGRGWVCNEEIFPVVGSNLLSTAMVTNNAGGGMDARAACGDILAGLADRVSFRGNTFLVIVCGQRLSPLGRVLADQRAAFTIVRDAFTGRWVVDHVVWLTE